MWEKFKKLLLFGGVSEKEYRLIRGEIAENNRRNLVVFSAVVCAAMAVMLAASLFDASLVKNRSTYWTCVWISAAVFAAAELAATRWRQIIYPCVYVFTGLLFWFGIHLGTIVDPHHLTVSFPILLFAIPLLFTDIPIRMDLEILGGIAVYFLLARKTQTSEILGYNTSNVLPYGLLSVFVSTYMMKLKMERFSLEQRNRLLSESDQLTGMENRRCYEQHLQRLRKEGVREGLKVVALDINGLKTANDNLGHHAGDELIRGAASCIQAAFGGYGRCYRTGGDEFMAVFENASPDFAELQRILQAQTAAWRGSLISGVSISIGAAVAASAEDSIDILVQQADKAMYDFKSEYYAKSGIDRRRR